MIITLLRYHSRPSENETLLCVDSTLPCLASAALLHKNQGEKGCKLSDRNCDSGEIGNKNHKPEPRFESRPLPQTSFLDAGINLLILCG